jgi:hypothetical protein
VHVHVEDLAPAGRTSGTTPGEEGS